VTILPFGSDWSAEHRRGSESEIRRWVDLALACCEEADRIALSHLRGGLQVERKADGTLVTQADREIERVLRERIMAAHPDHGLVGEEYGPQAADAAVRWYLDPIDGTHNFVRGIPLFATLIAVERDGEVQAGVISAPALGRRWYAWRGGGAWLVAADPSGGTAEAARLRASPVADVAHASIVFGSTRALSEAGLWEGLAGLIGRAWRDRGFGDFWGHALVAEGRAEAMVEVGLKPWDIAALLVLVEEAGGRLTDVQGRRGVILPQAITSNGILHGELLEALARR
jgi:histidinol-phosphatase